jgi:hypothetical protein
MESALYRFDDAPADLVRLGGRVNHDPLPRVCRDQCQILAPDALMKCLVGSVNPINVFAGFQPSLQSDPHGKVEKDAQVWLKAARRKLLYGREFFDRQPPATTLIRQGRIDVSVADHHLAICQCRAYNGSDVLSAGSREEQRLGLGQHSIVVFVQQNSPNLLANLRSSGFARFDHVPTDVAQSRCQ